MKAQKKRNKPTLSETLALLRKHSKSGTTRSILTSAIARIAALEKGDREAATYVESVIALRTDFTGDPPYVGWKGLGLALNEALDERDALMELTRRTLAVLTMEIESFIAIAPEGAAHHGVMIMQALLADVKQQLGVASGIPLDVGQVAT